MRWVVGEAWRDVRSGTAHALRSTLALALLVGSAAVVDVAGVEALLVRGAEFRDAGASVLTVEAPGAIDGGTCDALARLPGVRAAGALRQAAEPLAPATLPRGPVAAYLVSPGAPALLRADDSGSAGVLLASDAAAALGVGTGDRLVLDGTPTTVRGTYVWPDDGRRPGYAYAALLPATRADPYDACWVDAYPAPAGLAALARLAVLPAGDEQAAPVVVSQLNTTLGTTFDGVQAHAGRATRHAVWLSVAGGALLGFAGVRARRLELAAARHVGVTAPAQHLLLLLEGLASVLPAGVLVAAAVAVQVVTGTGEDPAALVRTAVHVAAPGLAAALLGAQVAAALTRESHLFRYFRTR
ncbi:hypothetical protein [Cellulomonas sp. ES6]|uniref:hypothetical protein n=1 Tax=Cellulomonas sp. ES6 TaxID=3039384 RepID=UPI0019B00A8E|nr:hypothetical protein [Cellulomonas sp. ES6]MBD3780216.1 hypothetical protein [Micrococcales bacterium]WHP18124.1 hypothetical protein P9841_02840 [Cellulomonas sp. ES6]